MHTINVPRYPADVALCDCKNGYGARKDAGCDTNGFNCKHCTDPAFVLVKAIQRLPDPKDPDGRGPLDRGGAGKTKDLVVGSCQRNTETTTTTWTYPLGTNLCDCKNGYGRKKALGCGPAGNWCKNCNVGFKIAVDEDATAELEAEESGEKDR